MLVLASASPRRQELLRNAGIAFIACPTDIPETPNKDEAPRAFAERMAREKALAAFDTQPEDFVLGADTIVVVDAEILGKPRNSADAARMLRLLSGTHASSRSPEFACSAAEIRKKKSSKMCDRKPQP